jgi:TetR/AcrR family transcriptional regulator
MNARAREARTGGAAPSRRRRPAGTRDRLIACGRAAFARHGYDGASVRAITRAAGANLGAITYHFGSKRALYEAVLEQVLAPLAERVMEATRTTGTVLDRAETTVRAFFAHLTANPDLPQLMLQEVSAGRRAPPPVQRALGTVSGGLAALLREGQLTGEVRAGDPVLLALSTVAQPVHLTLVQRIAREVVGVDQSDPEVRARVVDHAAAFARAGLAAHQEVS